MSAIHCKPLLKVADYLERQRRAPVRELEPTFEPRPPNWKIFSNATKIISNFEPPGPRSDTTSSGAEANVHHGGDPVVHRFKGPGDQFVEVRQIILDEPVDEQVSEELLEKQQQLMQAQLQKLIKGTIEGLFQNDGNSGDLADTTPPTSRGRTAGDETPAVTASTTTATADDTDESEQPAQSGVRKKQQPHRSYSPQNRRNPKNDQPADRIYQMNPLP